MGTLVKQQLVAVPLILFFAIGSCTAAQTWRRALLRDDDAVSWNAAAAASTNSRNAHRGIHAKSAPFAQRVSDPLVYSARGAGSHGTPSWSQHAAASRVATAAPHAARHAFQYAPTPGASRTARNTANHGSHGFGNIGLHDAAANQRRGGGSLHGRDVVVERLFENERRARNALGSNRLGSYQHHDGILEEHNKARQEVGVPDLAWDDGVAATAQEWANELASKGCPLEHGGAEGLGQNLYWLSPAGLTPEEDRGAVQSWVEEKADWTPSPIPDGCAKGKMCGHYTQVVWRDTTHVGCASAQCPDGSGMWVCNYSPPGNFVDQTPF
ncbi:unnamed protein product [Closterium sp. Naga37s-1]|nr:unnamed protein product [Closterium sp. Naga37s-1]